MNPLFYFCLFIYYLLFLLGHKEPYFYSFFLFLYFLKLLKQYLSKSSQKVSRDYTISKNVLGFWDVHFSKDVLKSMAKCRRSMIFHYLC
jgi:hypothetical protein